MQTMLMAWVRLLRIIVRCLLRTRLLQDRAWTLALKARHRFSRARPPIELETSFDENVRIITLLSDHIESQIFWQGFQEADEGAVKLLKQNLPVDGVFVDVGANIGTFTLVAAHRAYQGRVHSFEPSAYHFGRLARNVALNRFGNVVLNQKGLYDQPGEATLFLPCKVGEMNNSGAASLYNTNSSQGADQVSEAVSLIRIDDYVEDQGLGRLDIIKIDIEGAEIKALKGAEKTITRFRPLVLMELDRDNLARAGYEPDEVLDLWRSMGYKVAIILTTGETLPIASSKELGHHQNLECRPL
jgi:FkbM family methyltransferase